MLILTHLEMKDINFVRLCLSRKLVLTWNVQLAISCRPKYYFIDFSMLLLFPHQKTLVLKCFSLNSLASNFSTILEKLFKLCRDIQNCSSPTLLFVQCSYINHNYNIAICSKIEIRKRTTLEQRTQGLS